MTGKARNPSITIRPQGSGEPAPRSLKTIPAQGPAKRGDSPRRHDHPFESGWEELATAVKSTVRQLLPPTKGLLCILCITLSPALAFGRFLEPPITASISVPESNVPAGSKFDVIADFEMDSGVHLYRDKISFRWERLVGAEHVENLLPQGRKIRDEFGLNPNAMIEVYEDSVRVVARLRSTGKEGAPIVIRGKLGYQGCTDKLCYPLASAAIDLELKTAAAREGEKAEAVAEEKKEEPSAGGAEKKVEEAPVEKRQNAIWLILMAFGAGVGVSLTPCVYPMIPVTAAIIGGTKRKGKLGALLSSMIYVLGLSITYSLIGLLVASGGARVRTWLASPWVLAPIAGVFVLLALSMFEVISIQIQPKSLARLQTALSGKGRTLAIFGMGILSGFIAGPCVTAPLAGILVIVAKQANKLLGFFMLFALAWGMGIILIVAGTLTSALPKAGEWTVWVKKLLGFVMLWAAAYFVSPIIGTTAYRIATAAILVAGAVFLGGFDMLTRQSGFADRAKRFAGLLAVFLAAYLLLGQFFKGYHAARVEAFREASGDDVQKAIASGQAAVLYFSAEWCSICNHLDETTFTDPSVANAFQGIRALKLDFDKEPNLVEKFKIPGPPTVVFIGSDGKEIESLRFSGYKTAERFLEILKRLK